MPKATWKRVAGFVLSLFLFALSLPALTWAAPVEVVFFPESARVSEWTKVRLEPGVNHLKKATILLPSQADPDTLVTRIANASSAVIEDQSWRQVTRVDEDAVKSLKKKIAVLKEERISVQAAMKALDSQIQLWQMQTKARFKTLADASNMSAAMTKSIRKATAERLALDPELEKLDQQIKRLQEELHAAGGRKDTVWEVTVLLSGIQGPEASLSYAYNLGGCGWSARYRLEARPLEQKVLFAWEGEIWQSSGQDWGPVSVRLANRQPRSVLTPPTLPPWILKPKPVAPPVVYKKTGRAAAMAEVAAAAPLDGQGNEGGPAVPSRVDEGSYSSWHLGKRAIPAGVRQRVKVLEESWPAAFSYLCRPSQGEQVFVRAAVRFEEDRDLPRGQAVFFLDGALVGKRPFGLSGREETVFFGADPMVRVKSILLSRQSGEKTFLADKQTHSWRWRIDMENGRNHPVSIRIEEPLPQSRDERIRITLKNDPPPSAAEEGVQSWVLDCGPGMKRQLFTGVEVEAPKDMRLDLGWRP
jgi:uncharacterized protein (TIGR02231 family)